MDLDTDHGDITDETIKQGAQSVNQALLKTRTSKPINNLTQNKPLHNNTTNRLSTHDPNPSNIHLQANTQPTQTHRSVSSTNSITLPATSFDQAKQITMNIDALSCSPTLQDQILQEVNLHGLCIYNNTQHAYLYENSNKVVTHSHIIVFLKQSTCYALTPDRHQWFRINANEINDKHKITLCNDPTVHIMQLPSADPLEVNALNTIERLLHSHTSVNHMNNNHPQPSYNISTSSNNSMNNSPQTNTVTTITSPLSYYNNYSIMVTMTLAFNCQCPLVNQITGSYKEND